MMDLTGTAGLDNETRACAQTLIDQVLMDCAGREQRRNRHPIGRHRTIRQDQDVEARTHGVLGLRGERRNPRLDPLGPPGGRIADVEYRGLELGPRKSMNLTDLGNFLRVKNWLCDLQTNRRIDVIQIQQIGLGSNEADQGHHHLLADRVNRRIGDLREQLAEVVIKRFVLAREHGQRAVVAH